MIRENPYIVHITDFEGKVYSFEKVDNKLFFQNDRKVIQTHEIFPNTHFIVDFYRNNKDCDIQVIYPLTRNWDYNTYLILVYIWAKKELSILGYRSHTVYPPVWDRDFSFGPDYVDYINIQHYINKFLRKKGIETFDLDDELEGKSFNASTNTPEEIKELIKQGKPYNIICLKAEAAADKLELVKIQKI